MFRLVCLMFICLSLWACPGLVPPSEPSSESQRDGVEALSEGHDAAPTDPKVRDDGGPGPGEDTTTDAPRDAAPDNPKQPEDPTPPDDPTPETSPPEPTTERQPDTARDAQRPCEQLADFGATCRAGVGVCQRTGRKICTADGQGLMCNVTPDSSKQSPEVCDGKDNDCNGKVDDIGSGSSSRPQDQISTGTRYSLIWDPAGSGAAQPLTIWRPQRQIHTRLFGALATVGTTAPTDPFHMIRADSSLWAKPTSYTLVWSSKGTGSTRDLSFWSAVCPAGFVSLGVAATAHHRPPEGHGIACISQSLATPAQIDQPLWRDQGIHAQPTMTLWSLKGSPYPIAAKGSQPPSQKLWRLDPSLQPLCPAPPTPQQHPFQITFDYRFAEGYFNDPKRRKTLEDAAAVWSKLIADNFPFVPAGTTYTIKDWAQKEHTVTLDKDVDDLRVLSFVQKTSSYKALANKLGDTSIPVTY